MDQKNNLSRDGLLLCCSYAFPPNRLGLCGPEHSPLESFVANSEQTNKKTQELLGQFPTMYPYLQFIAGFHGIKDPFHPEVVEAYWIGNSLSRHIPLKSYNAFIKELQSHKKNTWTNTKKSAISSSKTQFIPTHAQHVLTLWQEQLILDDPLLIQALNACLIHPVRVIEDLTASVLIEYQPLVFESDLLSFGQHICIEVKKHQKLYKRDQGAAIHWGHVVRTLSEREYKRLVFYNQLALHAANNVLNERKMQKKYTIV